MTATASPTPADDSAFALFDPAADEAASSLPSPQIAEPAKPSLSGAAAKPWNRRDNLPKGHKLYTSVATLTLWLHGSDLPLDYTPIRRTRPNIDVRPARRYRDSTLISGLPGVWLYGCFLPPIAPPRFKLDADRIMARLRWRETGDLSLIRPKGIPTPEPKRRAGNDNAPASSRREKRVRYRGGYPALNWLAKRHPDKALAVLGYMRTSSAAPSLHHPDEQEAWLNPLTLGDDGGVSTPYVHDGDGEAPDVVGFGEVSVQSEDGPDTGYQAERLHDVRPDINEMMADLLRARVLWRIDGSVHRVTGNDRLPTKYNGKLVLAGMTFSRNPRAKLQKIDPIEMQTYTDGKGRICEPRTLADKPRGGKSQYRSDANIGKYLTRPGATASPLTAAGLRTPMSSEPAIPPMLHSLDRRAPGAFMDQYGKLDMLGRFGVEEAREYLRHYGVDASVTFEGLPFPATKCPIGRTKGARFIAGISAGKQTKSAPAIGKEWVPEAMEGEAGIVLDEVAARGNLTRIGMRLGKSKGYADRYAKRALLAAADELLALNDNELKKVAA